MLSMFQLGNMQISAEEHNPILDPTNPNQEVQPVENIHAHEELQETVESSTEAQKNYSEEENISTNTESTDEDVATIQSAKETPETTDSSIEPSQESASTDTSEKTVESDMSDSENSTNNRATKEQAQRDNKIHSTKKKKKNIYCTNDLFVSKVIPPKNQGFGGSGSSDENSFYLNLIRGLVGTVIYGREWIKDEL